MTPHPCSCPAQPFPSLHSLSPSFPFLFPFAFPFLFPFSFPFLSHSRSFPPGPAAATASHPPDSPGRGRGGGRGPSPSALPRPAPIGLLVPRATLKRSPRPFPRCSVARRVLEARDVARRLLPRPTPLLQRRPRPAASPQLPPQSFPAQGAAPRRAAATLRPTAG